MWGCQFAASVHGPSSGRKNEQGEWYGIDVENPNTDDHLDPFVLEPERFVQYQQMHEFLAAKHMAGLIKVDHDEQDDGMGAGGVGGTASSTKAEF
jgi:hypothetical protein